MELPDFVAVIRQLEGPYKWYVLAGVILLLTLFFTRFVFRTIKWFLLILAFATILTAAVTLYLQ